MTCVYLPQEDRVTKLEGYQRKHLRGLAHRLKPVVHIGQRGLSAEAGREFNAAMDVHELIKVKFVAHKGREEKEAITADIEAATGAEMVGLIGHTAIFFRQHRDPERRQIKVPTRR